MIFGGKNIKTKRKGNFWLFYWESLIPWVFGVGIKFDKKINAFIISYKLLETHSFPSLEAISTGQISPLKSLSEMMLLHLYHSN